MTLLDLSPLASLVPTPKRRPARGASLTRLKAVKLAKRLAALRAESLALYQPLPAAELFHASTAKFRVVDGSNRSGKTNAGAVEACRMLCGVDPYDKYVRKDGIALIIGLNTKHLATMWKKCARPGAFSIIRDEHTNLWRSVRPDPNDPLHLDPYDLAYQEKWKDAPPFLPPRLIKSLAWEDKGKGVPRLVTFFTGWESWWHSSEGKSPQGDHLNGVWLDEHLDNEDFFNEAKRGIVALKERSRHIPRLFWSATPQTLNPQLSDLREEAERGDKHTAAFRLLLSDNPYVPDEEKEIFFNGLTEDERHYRWYGLPAIATQRVYPGYDPQGTHGCEPFAVDISRWARYVCIDPGRQHCGTVLFAIDPEARPVWIYDAFDLRHADAQRWAGEIAKRQYDTHFEAFVIDQQMGKQTRPGAAHNTARQYFTALTAAGVRPKSDGPLCGFYPGTSDIPAREEALLGWLAIRGAGPFAGSPILQVMKGISPQLDKQFRDAVYKVGKRYKKPDQDILVCLEYMAGFAPRYRLPSPVISPEAPKKLSVHEQFIARRTRLNDRRRDRSLLTSP